RVRRRVHHAERHQELAVGRELADRVVAVVGAVDALVRTDGDAVGPVREVTLAPGVEEVALAVVDDDGMVAAADQVHAHLGVDGDARDVTVLVALGQLRPALDHAIAQLGLTHDDSSSARQPRAATAASASNYGRDTAASQGAPSRRPSLADWK